MRRERLDLTGRVAVDEAGPERLPQQHGAGALGVLLVATGSVSAQGTGKWTKGAPMPSERTEVAVAELQGKIYVVGGFGGQRELEIYDPAANSWSRGKEFPRAVHHAAAVGLNGKLYVIGGYVHDWAPTNAAFDALPEDARRSLTAPERRERLVSLLSFHIVPGTVTAADLGRAVDRGEGGRAEIATVTGDTSQRDRTEIFTAFQNTEKYRVLNAHPECMSHGLTLTAADTIIWFGPVTKLETYEQANARITRVGQVHKQQIIRLVSTAAERVTYRRLQDRHALQENILGLLADITNGDQ